ncbi:hypothetical protein AK88_01565 [Plasmodium fragile]|uniref:Uncharacterized protein n=1 Tax=Plasmodium fragile TaxID=5857 RepID=A0A0D9QNR9_PLAFR|nr:uncharacterized protein AK88_01565 [Plasmodium fragile]KJP88684.1 hypothetical protein AK88_01565 [Plasmodium fragile]
MARGSPFPSKKKLKANEAVQCKGRRQNEANPMETNFLVTQKNKKGNLEKYTYGKVWLYNKINSLYTQFNMFKMSIQRGDHREQKGKRPIISMMNKKRGEAQRYTHEHKNVKTKKRKFADTSNEHNAEAGQTERKNQSTTFHHLEILKSLLCIYQFYTTDDGSGDMGLPPVGGAENGGVQNGIKHNGTAQNGTAQKYNFQDNEKYNKSLSDIFSSIVNDKCGFFFIFNAIFFTNLKNFYYFVDIINVLNYLGNGKTIKGRGGHMEKDILIYEQIASFVENCYCCFVNDVDNGCNCWAFNQTCPSGKSTRITHTRKINSDKVEKIKNKLKELKKEKSHEELLFISMNECNKKIFHEFCKIPDLFCDMTEISEYSRSEPSKEKYSPSDYAPSEIIHAQSSTELSKKSLGRKSTLVLYNQSDYTKSGTYDDSRTGSLHILKNSLSMKSEVYPFLGFLHKNNSYSLAKGDPQLKGEMPSVRSYPNQQTSNLVNTNEHAQKGYNIKNFFANLFKYGQANEHPKGTTLPAEQSLPKLEINEEIAETNHLEIGKTENGTLRVGSNAEGEADKSDQSSCDEEEAKQSVDSHLEQGCPTVKEPSNMAPITEHSGKQSSASSSLSQSSAEEEQSNSEEANDELSQVEDTAGEKEEDAQVEPLNEDKTEQDLPNNPDMMEEKNIEQNDGKENYHHLCEGEDGGAATEEKSQQEILLCPPETEMSQVNKTENHDGEEVDAALGGEPHEQGPLECNEMEENTIKDKVNDDGKNELETFTEENSGAEVFSKSLMESDEPNKSQIENENKLVDNAESGVSPGQMQNEGGATEGLHSGSSNPNGEAEISEQSGTGLISIAGEGKGNDVVGCQGEQLVDPIDELDERTSEHDGAERESAGECVNGEDAANEKISSKEDQKEENGSLEPPQKKQRTEEAQNVELNDQVSQSEKADNANTPEDDHSISSADDDDEDDEEDDSDELDNDEEEDDEAGEDEYDQDEDEEEVEEEEEECNQADAASDDDHIVHFLKSNRGNQDRGWYAEYLRNLLRCDKKCTVENHAQEKDLFLSKVKKLSNLVKYKKFKEKYTNEWEQKIALFKCDKLRRAYRIFLAIIFSIVKEIKELKRELKDMSQFVFINSGIENYLNENNISTARRKKESGVGANRFNDYHLGSDSGYGGDNVINSFFLRKAFSSEDSEKKTNGEKKKKKKYISYVPLKNYHILFQSIKEIFNEQNVQDKLAHISYYIELDKDIPPYCSLFFRQFKIKKQVLFHIQSLYSNSVPTVPCVNMFIACLNYNYSNVLKKKFVFQSELNNSYLAKFPCVYCCNVQIVRHVDFLKLKETCHRIIKENKIHQLFVDHLSSSLLDESYFIVPFFTSYGKFLMVIKSNRSSNPDSSSTDVLQNKNCITYDILINSFVFPNGSSFQAIVHLSYVFVNTLRDFFKTRNSDENIPEISFLSLPHVDKQQLLHHEIESAANRTDIIINVLFLLESFFNNTKKMKAPAEFNQGLRFLYIIRLLEFFHQKGNL